MEGRAGFPEDVVGDVDDVVDRFVAGGGDLVLQPLGAGADLDVLEQGQGVIGAGPIFIGERDFPVGGDGGPGHLDLGHRLERAAAERRQLAGEAAVGEEIGAVRGDFEIDDGVGGDGLGERAEGGALRQEQQALGVLGQAEFLGRAHHALGELAAQLALLDGEAAGEFRAGQGERHPVADLEVLRAADDLAGLRAGGHLAEAEPVGIRMGDVADHLGDDDVGIVDPAPLDALDLRTAIGQPLDERLDGTVERQVVLKPAEREFHRDRDSSAQRGK